MRDEKKRRPNACAFFVLKRVWKLRISPRNTRKKAKMRKILLLFYFSRSFACFAGKKKVLERISIKRDTMAVGDNVGARPGACPMSAANNRLNLFNFECHYPFERHSPLWAGTRPAPTFCVSFY
jgi:hypothetical protein